MKSTALFSYGTLQYESVQRKLFGRLLDCKADVLIGYKLDSIAIADATYLIAVKSENATQEIAGQVLTITTEELAAADAYEGADYQRIEVNLKSGQVAWVYVKASDT